MDAFNEVVKGGTPGVYQAILFWESNMGFIIKLLYMAIKLFKRPLVFDMNKVSKLIRAKVIGARSGAGPTRKKFKMVPSNKNRVKLTGYEHWFQKGIFLPPRKL